MGMSVPLTNESVSFATGIVLTFGAGTDTPEPSEIVCETPCDPVTNQTMSETTIPYYAPEELTYDVNEDVDVCITIQCPETASINYNGMPVSATISSMTITGFTNLPDGLSYCVSRTDIDPTTNNFATLHLTGTATAAGVFDLNISCNATGSANVMGNNLPISNQAVTFPTGIVVTIEEQASNAVAANFTTNPTATQLLGGSVIYITAGETITYTNASENATTIEWTFEGGNPSTSSNNVVEVTYATAGNYTTTLIAYGENNEQSTKTVGVNVSEAQSQNNVVANFTTNPEATQLLGGSVIYITAGETITYTNASENATSIEWTFEGGNPSSSTDNTVEVTYATAGNYTTTLTAYGANNEQNTKTVGVNVSEPEPQNNVVADFTTDPEPVQFQDYISFQINAGETITYTNTSQNAASIAWTFEGGNPATSTENIVTVTYTEGGVFSTALTAYNEDQSESNTKTITVYVAEIVDNVNETAISEISVYPNPTSSVINIAAKGMQNITIIDMTGRVVMSKDVNSNFETISAEGFAKANYMVRIATADGVVVKNIVVE